jgi:hypothetical protein
VSVATVAELRRLHVVSSESVVVHHPSCRHLRRIVRGGLAKIGDDPRYYAGELRSGDCCRPIVPKPDAPDDGEGWRYT